MDSYPEISRLPSKAVWLWLMPPTLATICPHEDLCFACSVSTEGRVVSSLSLN